MIELLEKEILIPITKTDNLINYLKTEIFKNLYDNEYPIRFVITKTDDKFYYCEIGIVIDDNKNDTFINKQHSIFENRQRVFENTEKFNAVLLVPTGIGAEIGGHCGDANVIARLIATSCDTLITHPNVVNASDINEMTENTLYVEGSIITKLMMGQIGLQKVRSNRIIMLMDTHPEDQCLNNEIVNAVSSARVTLGLDCDVIQMKHNIISTSVFSPSGRAAGHISYLEKLYKYVDLCKNSYDAIGLSTIINVPLEYHHDYYIEDKMVNPWGSVEAMLTHSVALKFNIPCAHSPLMFSKKIFDTEFEPRGIIDPRKAPETASITYLHCILKGLHKTPKIVNYDKGLNLEDISCIIIPYGCMGLPVLSAIQNNIPVIAVKENKNIMKNDYSQYNFNYNKFFIVNTYLEAAGIMQMLKAGITLNTIQRPIQMTEYFNENV